MKTLGEAWRTLGPAEREIYECKAEQDKLRYKVEKAGLLPKDGVDWTQRSDEERGELVQKMNETTAVIGPLGVGANLRPSLRRPRNAYTVFMQEMSTKLKHDVEFASQGSFMQGIATLWRELPVSERQHYEEVAAEEQRTYAKTRKILLDRTCTLK